MGGMRFSLIVATRGRTRELSELLDSLTAQGRPRDALEVIVVDQNGDERLAPVVAEHAGRLDLRRRRSAVANACHARNLGIAEAGGEVVAFPDDDCLYPPGVLDRVEAAFAADPSLQVLTGPAASPAGGLGSGRWRRDAGPITASNVWTSVIEFNLFLRRETALALGGFDARLGPGTEWGSAEGNDLVLRAVRAGHRAAYDPELRILHPDKRLTEVARERAALYGRGLGFVLRRHGVPAAVWLPYLVRPMGGVALSLLRGRTGDAGYYWGSLTGRLRGLRAPAAREGLPLPPIAPVPATAPSRQPVAP
jgi:glycosyltransferase involved in cell wall biosynthesis